MEKLAQRTGAGWTERKKEKNRKSSGRQRVTEKDEARNKIGEVKRIRERGREKAEPR